MARENLTDRRLRSLKPAPVGKRHEIFDAQVPAMGIRITDKGVRTFFLLARYGTANPTRRALGKYPALELKAAREKAREWLALLDRGIDPSEKVKDDQRARELAKARHEERSFEVVLEKYILARKRDGVRKASIDERDFNREFVPAWKNLSVDEIRMDDIMQVIKKIHDRGKIRQALNIAQKIGTFFSWCVDADIIEFSPYRPKRIRTEIGEKVRRDSVLSDNELRAFWKATESLGQVYQGVYRLLVLTGQRLNDIAQASWPEINLDDRTLVVPAERYKSDRDHVIPLPDDSLAIFEDMPHWKNCSWIFSLDGDGAATIGSKIKLLLDEKMLGAFREITGDENAIIEPWVNHDLRRTVRTRLSDLDVFDEVAEIVIGHAPSALNRTYNKSDRLRVKLEALNRWQIALHAIVANEKQPTKVIKLLARA